MFIVISMVIVIVNDNVYGTATPIVHVVDLMNIAPTPGGRRPLDEAGRLEPQICLNWQL